MGSMAAGRAATAGMAPFARTPPVSHEEDDPIIQQFLRATAGMAPFARTPPASHEEDDPIIQQFLREFPPRKHMRTGVAPNSGGPAVASSFPLLPPPATAVPPAALPESWGGSMAEPMPTLPAATGLHPG